MPFRGASARTGPGRLERRAVGASRRAVRGLTHIRRRSRGYEQSDDEPVEIDAIAHFPFDEFEPIDARFGPAVRHASINRGGSARNPGAMPRTKRAAWPGATTRGQRSRFSTFLLRILDRKWSVEFRTSGSAGPPSGRDDSLHLSLGPQPRFLTTGCGNKGCSLKDGL